MLAHHPITGKEIRVIQTDASIWKEHKTLVFSSVKGVYDTVGLAGSGGDNDFVLHLEPTGAAEFVKSSSSSRLVFVSKKGMGQMSLAEFKRLKIGNVMGLEELHKLYPHIGDPWDGSIEDACAIVAGLLRYRRLAGVWNNRATFLGLERVTEPPGRLWWLTQYYTPSSGGRRKEIQKCLERNSQSSLIDRIILLNEKKEGIPKGTELGGVPIEERIIGKRLTYADVFKIALTFPKDVILAFANADICIDDASWKSLWDVNLENKFLALLRYDVPASGNVAEARLFGPRADSQDTWVVRVADIIASGVGEKAGSILDFNFGRMGCDNAIALEMLRQKFLVINPALSMKTWHFHSSGVRTYDKLDVIERSVFHYIQPSGFHDLNPVFSFSKEEIHRSFKPSSFFRPVRGNGATSWLISANQKDSENCLKLENANTLVLSEEMVISVKNCFETPGGLVFDKNRLLIGKAIRSQKLWSKTIMTATTPSLDCERGLVAPWPEGAETSRELYIVKYLSKVLQLVPENSQGITAAQKAAMDGWEFFCPEKKDIVEALESFQWRTGKLPVIKHEEDIVIWCKEARILLPSENSCVLLEDMAALRKSVRQWTPDVEKFTDGKLRIVIVEDGKVITAEISQKLEEALEENYDVKVVYPERTSSHRMVSVLNGSWGTVSGGGWGACGWNWLMPLGAYVFEASSAGDRAGMEVSSASSLEHRYCLPTVDSVLREIGKAQESWKLSVPVSENLPILWVPRSDLEGYFAHPGDSFREMARLWASSGLCSVREHPTATMVWWGEVGAGGVLLYDRPNHDWRLAAPLLEKEWKYALFGNPKCPTGQSKTSPWFFWPRRPLLVEDLVASGAAATSWRDRLNRLVFYGKTENKVQERRRTTADWQSACSDWVMVKGEETYPFTQTQYLENLSKSKFGLCLAGYGYKCHREVECMSMGCVPICAPDVDMDSYARPPSPGVHYVRVSTPEEARLVSESMSEEAWTLMSEACKTWWKENASCSGSFQLTKELIQ